MKIVLFGLAKSGTSALFYKVRNSLPPGTIALFEPASYGLGARIAERMKALLRGRPFPDVVAKVLPFDPRPVRAHDFDGFDRQVLIVRDPRDRLVSVLLYRCFHADFAEPPSDALSLLDLLRRKEADPRSVPLLRIVETLAAVDRTEATSGSWLEGHAQRGVAAPLAFHRARPGMHVFRYEQLVAGRFEELEDLFGLALHADASVPNALRRVVRTKSSGAWRHWLTPTDVDALRPVLGPYLDRYYPDADWDLASAPRLDPDHGSLYVERVINERRALWGLPPLPTAAT